ncbi:MAG: hypothetical protein JXQ73_21645 [Phycisphaerae bacterium]|nr:hypothetical protein [Phycisphaerae bacterium]
MQRARRGDAKRPEQIYLQLAVRDRADREVTNAASVGLGRRLPKPRFKIVDAAGKTVHSANFEYG